MHDFEKSLLDMLKEVSSEYGLFPNSLQYGKYADDDEKDDIEFKKIKLFEEEYPALEEVPHEKRKGVYSTAIASIAQVNREKSKYKGLLKIKIPNILKPMFDLPGDTVSMQKYKEKNLYFQFYISPESKELIPYLKKLVIYSIKNYRSCNNRFGCCSSFNRCSDEGHCVHYNQLYATGCIYRTQHLEKGEIFYGNK